MFALLLVACGDPSEKELLASGRAFLQKSDPQAAVIQLKNLVRRAPASAEGRLLLGSALLDTGDAAGAVVELQRAQELGAAEAAVVPSLARALLAQRDYKRLVAQYADTELPDPKATAELKVALARAQRALGADEPAQRALARALQLAPTLEAALIVDAQGRLHGGDADGASRVIADLLAREPGSADGWQLQGDLRRAARDGAGAVEAYRKAVALRPRDATLHASLINAYFDGGDAKAAAKQLEALKAAQPQHPLTGYYEARFAYARQDYAQARELLAEPLRLQPDDVNLLNLAAATELELGAPAQAEADLGRALALQPDYAEARRTWARLHLRANAPRQALAVLQSLLDRPGADAQTLALAGQASAAAGDAKAADAYFARAAALGPHDPAVRLALALSRLARGDADAGLRELQALADEDGSGGVDLTLVRTRIARNELDAALAATQALQRKRPDSPLPWDFRARVQLLRKDPAAARASFEQAVAKDARYFPAVASLAAMDLQEKQPAAAQARLEALLKASPTHEQALLAMADLKRRSGGTPAEIAVWLGRAVQANPASVQPRLALIELQRSSGQAAAALQTAQEAVAALPTQPDLADRLGRLYLAAGDLNQAGATFARLVSQNPDGYLGPLGLAEVKLAAQDVEGAERQARRAQELAPDALPVQRLAMTLALRGGRWPEALALVHRMQQQRPDDAVPWIFEGELQASRQQWDAAAAALRKAAALPEPAQAPGMLYGVLVQSGKAAEADRFATAWLQQHPGDLLFQLYQGNVALAQGDVARAQGHFGAVLKAQPDNVVALNNLAQLLIAARQPGAVALAERATRAAPGQAALFDTLALALAAENQPAKALDLQKRVVAQSPGSPAFRLTLAKIYLQSGDKTQARVELEGLLKPGRDFPGRAEASALMKSLGSA